LEAQSRLDNPFSPENARLQLYFDGDVYSGLDTYSIPLDKLETLQDSLRILSVCMDLEAFDLMQAYRLEMGTSCRWQKTKNLYEFWKLR
jgi:cytoplasmic iron level regulating protein YaaA (DUF328/UPF0246 family)